MAKKKAPKTSAKKKPAAKKGPRRLASPERIQHRPSVDVVPDKPLELGPVLLPDPERAVAVLAELADLNDRALQAHKAYLERQAAAKKAKENWDDLAKQVQDKLRLATHGSGLPLFDKDEREADQARMEAAAAQDAPGEAIVEHPGSVVEPTEPASEVNVENPPF